MNTKQLLLQYVTYNHWANKRLADVLLKINSALLDKEIKSSFPSLRKTVHHIWDAELTWMARLNNENIVWPPSTQYINPSIDKFVSTSRDFVDFINSKEVDFFDSSTSYKNSKGDPFTNPNQGIIMHCMNHGTYHRGQLVTMFRELEITELPNTDLITFLREK